MPKSKELFHEPNVTSLDENSTRAITYASTTMPILEASYERYRENYVDMLANDEFEESDMAPKDEVVVGKHIEMATKLKEILGEGRQMMNLNSTIMGPYQSQNQSHTMHDLKLPPMTIPTLSGEFEDWVTFYDTFTTYIDNAPIPDVSKMHFLKTNLSGSALKMIQNFPTTDANYKIAWKTLCDRFDNKRNIVNACLRSFVLQDVIKEANAQQIRDLIDTTKQAIQCIEAQQISTDAWDPILVYILQLKFGPYLSKEWEIQLKGQRGVPTYDDAISLLETQHRIFESTPMAHFQCNLMSNVQSNSIPHYEFNSMPSTSANAGGNSRTIATMRTNEKEKNQTKRKGKDECIKCLGDHYIFFCPTFNGWSIEERWQFVNEKNLCKKCVHSHKGECRSKYKCNICKGNHNTKLHKEDMQMNAIQSPTIDGSNKLFATAIVKVQDNHGSLHLLRAFIDGGSEGAVISERALQLLNLQSKREHIPLTGLDGVSLGKVASSVRIQVQSATQDSFKFGMDALGKRSIVSS